MSFSTVSAKQGPASARSNATEIRISACLDCGTPLPVHLLELARMDLLFITDRPLRFGTAVQLAIFSDFVSAVTQNRATVHWCRPHAQGWQIGAFLTQPLPDRLTELQWSDLRGSLKYDCNWKAWILWDVGGSLESIRILNYSISGLQILSSRMVNANQDFTLFGSGGSRDPAVLNGKTQWCREFDDGFQICGMIQGQRGRDLPRMFGNLAAVHIEGNDLHGQLHRESLDTLRCSHDREARFLPPRRSETRRHSSRDDVANLLES